MIKIENRLSQPLVINQGQGRVLHLLAGGRAVIDEADMGTAEISELLACGSLTASAIATVAPIPDAAAAAAAPVPPAAANATMLETDESAPAARGTQPKLRKEK